MARPAPGFFGLKTNSGSNARRYLQDFSGKIGSLEQSRNSDLSGERSRNSDLGGERSRNSYLASLAPLVSVVMTCGRALMNQPCALINRTNDEADQDGDDDNEVTPATVGEVEGTRRSRSGTSASRS